MSRSDDERIADILDAADELAVIVACGRPSFDEDPILRRAAERLLEIVGEAANTLAGETTDRYPDVPWTDVTRLRIALAHHYHRVDADPVWGSPPTSSRPWPVRSGMGFGNQAGVANRLH